MKIKAIFFTILAIFICNAVSAQSNKDYIDQRTRERLQERGLTESEITKAIRESDSIQGVVLRNIKEKINLQVEAERNTAGNNQNTTVTCNDVVPAEKAALLALKQELNGGSWLTTWNPSNPVRNNNHPGGWYGVSVTYDGCHVEGINVTAAISSIPDLSSLHELDYLGLINTGANSISSTSNYTSIGTLSNLEYLEIKHANFGGMLPSNFSNLNPRHFILDDCNLTDTSQLATIISNYTNLRALILNNNFNSVTNSPFILPNNFQNLQHLRFLSFTNSKIYDANILNSLPEMGWIILSSNLISSFPDFSNLAIPSQVGIDGYLSRLFLNNNLMEGNIPGYLSNISHINELDLSINRLYGDIPSLHLIAVGDITNHFRIDYNFFRFNDFVDEFNYYSSFVQPEVYDSLMFNYSPQAKTDNIENITANVGQQITMIMCIDGNFNAGDTYQWYKNGVAINGAEALLREYVFYADANSAGVYTCESKHFSPPITNTNDPITGRNLTLYRNDITLMVNPQCFECTSFDLQLGKKYVITGWVSVMKDMGESNYQKLNVFNYDNAKIAVTFLGVGGGIIGTQQIFGTTGEIIDGWQKIYGEITIPTDIDDLKIELVNSYQSPISVFFDDIRVHPVDGNMKSFVYDQESQKLMAELDENNYATFYEYDKEGGLVRVKKETEKGVYTIQETRSSTTKIRN